MQLNTDLAFHLSIRCVVVDENAHHMSVNQLDQNIFARNDANIVPIAVFDEASQLRVLSHRSDGAGLLTIGNHCDLPAQSKKTPSAFLINLARVLLLQIDVRLVAFHDPLRDLREFNASILDSAVAVLHAGKAVFRLEFEIRWLAPLPDTESVLFRLMSQSRLTDNRAVFHSPEVGIAVPTLQGLAIEDRLESLFFKRLDGRFLRRVSAKSKQQ